MRRALPIWIVMRKKFTCPLQVGISGLLNRFKNTNMIILSVVLYLCYVLSKALIKTNATYAKLVVFLSCFVFAVLLNGYFAKIGKTIVEFVAVNMVKVFFRKRAGFNKPNKSMCCIFLPRKLNVSVAVWGNDPSNRADLNPWALFSLKQQAACWNIIQHIKHKIFGYGVCVHA